MPSAGSSLFPIKDTNAEISPHEQCVFRRYANYLIAYGPDKEPLLVLSVLDGRRSPRVLAAILRGRK
jgi:hypothetical protein